MPRFRPAPGLGPVARRFFADFLADDLLTHAAALAFYTTLALSPLLLLALTIAGSLYMPAQDRLVAELAGLVGPQLEPVLRQLIDGASARPDLRHFAGWGSAAFLLLGASAVLAQLQAALNRIWDCPARAWTGVAGFLLRRLLSAGVLLALLFLTILSMGVQAALSSLPGPDEGWLLWLGTGFGWLVYAAVFSALYHWLPDCRVPWRTAIRGGLLTAALFMLGRVAIGAYLARTDAAGAFGAAGGLLLWLLWAYYSTLIFLVSAELLYALSCVRGWHLHGPGPAVRGAAGTQSQDATRTADRMS